MNRFPKILAAALAAAFLLSAATYTFPQAARERVPFKRLYNENSIFCSPSKNALVTKVQLEVLFSSERCENESSPEVEFDKQSLLSYRVGGDCMMKVAIDIQAVRSERKYLVFIENTWGGCRAGGVRRGWIVTEKIPDGYSVEFRELKIDDPENTLDALRPRLRKTEPDRRYFTREIQAKQIELHNCVSAAEGDPVVIRDRESLDDAIRKDASRQ
ncbi:MAG: hypothetical protein DWQ47_07530 [Acidobacteria bacterium]|nr:MAG: hypothetical protein DWQ32_15630 [Acidobacteriota bacterium]REJ99226.1 MAG: hypothetical protein DWQ38_14345 [Acidobacteriota bacterium]REK16053.1 MAG: hypothetical protein DWQ43_03340 [Acidobacteriota bacterium]REK43734.1 MAG: hypothetical protein DWQ47_07530 [Acidobacteriota bacterium]